LHASRFSPIFAANIFKNMKNQNLNKPKGRLPAEIKERNDMKEIIERKNLQNKVLKKMLDEINTTDNHHNKS